MDVAGLGKLGGRPLRVAEGGAAREGGGLHRLPARSSRRRSALRLAARLGELGPGPAAGGCKEWLPLQTGVLASTPGADVFLASPDIPLFCVGDVVRGRWPRELALAGGRIFSYVLNNYWHTNYKASQGGAIAFGYRLTSDRSIAPDRAFRLGWAARRPLYAQRMSFQDFREIRPPYEEPAGGALAQVSPEQVVLSTLKGARWAEGYVARLQEIGGAAREATVAFPGRPVARAWATDLLEREERELPVEPDGTLRVDVPAWGLATVRIVLER